MKYKGSKFRATSRARSFLFKRSLLSLIIAFSGATFTANANGTGGIMVLIQNTKMKTSNETTVPAVPSDGFIFSKQFYRSGADFFVCDGITSDKGKVVADGEGCSVEVKKIAPWYSFSGIFYTYEHIGTGFTLQQYLDLEVGKGLTKPVSVGLKNNRLIVFYKKVKDSITKN